MRKYKPGQVYEDVNGDLWRVDDKCMLRLWMHGGWYEGEFPAHPADLEDNVGPLLLTSKSPSEQDDAVNHPSHYADGWSNGAEVIDLVEHLKFNRGAAVKYLCRAGKKGGPEKELEDLRKAQWFVNREVARLEASGGNQ